MAELFHATLNGMKVIYKAIFHCRHGSNGLCHPTTKPNSIQPVYLPHPVAVAVVVAVASRLVSSPFSAFLPVRFAQTIRLADFPRPHWLVLWLGLRNLVRWTRYASRRGLQV